MEVRPNVETIADKSTIGARHRRLQRFSKAGAVALGVVSVTKVCPLMEIARSIRDPCGNLAPCIGANCQFWNSAYKDCQLKFGT